jgi:hypothetical protein
MSLFFLLVLTSFCAYRAGRFIALDDLIKETREKVLDWLTSLELVDGQKHVIDEHSAFYSDIPLWRRKAATLLTCPFCVTAYTSALSVLILMAFESVPLPVYFWGATWTGALIVWAIVDSD